MPGASWLVLHLSSPIRPEYEKCGPGGGRLRPGRSLATCWPRDGLTGLDKGRTTDSLSQRVLERTRQLSDAELLTVAVASFPAVPQSVTAARRFVHSALEDLADGEVVEVAVLLTSEVVTNAVVHADSAVEVTLRRSAGALQVAVRDQCPRLPVLSPPVGLQESGRGLVLVNEMADVWGTEPTGAGKIVWFQLARAAAGRYH